MNVDQKSLETVFLIAICRQAGDKWQSKTLFQTALDLRSSIVFMFSIATYLVWIYTPCLGMQIVNAVRGLNAISLLLSCF